MNEPNSSAERSIKVAVVLSGVAPAMTLMSGAMLEFAKAGIAIDTISTSGVGGLIGMLYLAPRNGQTPESALADLPNLYTSDLFNSVVPFNVKLFHKKGPFAEPIWRMGKKIPRYDLDPKDPNKGKRLYNDLVDFWLTALTPGTLSTSSKGMMTPMPIVDELVDFPRLKASPTNFYLNAFNASTRRLKIFTQHELNASTYAAAQAMAFLYPLERFGKDVYSIGATHDPTGLQALWMHPDKSARPDVIICLDSMSYGYWRPPEGIGDAFQLMLLNPIVALQRSIYALYASTEYMYNQKMEQLGADAPPLARMPRLYRIPMDEAMRGHNDPDLLSWTHSSAVALESVGRASAAPVVAALDTWLKGGSGAALEKYRFRNYADYEQHHGAWQRKATSGAQAGPQEAEGFIAGFEQAMARVLT